MSLAQKLNERKEGLKHVTTIVTKADGKKVVISKIIDHTAVVNLFAYMNLPLVSNGNRTV